MLALQVIVLFLELSIAQDFCHGESGNVGVGFLSANDVSQQVGQAKAFPSCPYIACGFVLGRTASADWTVCAGAECESQKGPLFAYSAYALGAAVSVVLTANNSAATSPARVYWMDVGSGIVGSSEYNVCGLPVPPGESRVNERKQQEPVQKLRFVGDAPDPRDLDIGQVWRGSGFASLIDTNHSSSELSLCWQLFPYTPPRSIKAQYRSCTPSNTSCVDNVISLSSEDGSVVFPWNGPVSTGTGSRTYELVFKQVSVSDDDEIQGVILIGETSLIKTYCG